MSGPQNLLITIVFCKPKFYFLTVTLTTAQTPLFIDCDEIDGDTNAGAIYAFKNLSYFSGANFEMFIFLIRVIGFNYKGRLFRLNRKKLTKFAKFRKSGRKTKNIFSLFVKIIE